MTELRSIFLPLLATAALLGAPPSVAQEEANFFDDFQGGSLNPAFAVLNPDTRRLALTQGEFLLLVIDDTGKNVVQYNGTLPEDYAVTIRIDEPPVHGAQAFEIFVGNYENSVRTGVYLNRSCGGCDPYGPFFFTTKVLDGEQSPNVEFEDTSMRGQPFLLKLEKRGVEFQGFLSTDGAKWTSLGKQVLIDPAAKIHFHAHAFQSAPETPVKIDSFEVTELLN